MTKEGEGLLADDHDEIHLLSELTKLCKKQAKIHFEQMKILNELGNIYDKKAKNGYRFEHGRKH
jgi:hypothetical protein